MQIVEAMNFDIKEGGCYSNDQHNTYASDNTSGSNDNCQHHCSNSFTASHRQASSTASFSQSFTSPYNKRPGRRMQFAASQTSRLSHAFPIVRTYTMALVALLSFLSAFAQAQEDPSRLNNNVGPTDSASSIAQRPAATANAFPASSNLNSFPTSSQRQEQTGVTFLAQPSPSNGQVQPNTNLFPGWNGGGRPFFGFGPNVGVSFNLTEFPKTMPGTSIVTFNAYGNAPGDSDSNNYSFFITPSSDPKRMFSIGAKDGKLKVAGQLDREDTEMYILKIGAQDEAGNIGYTTVTITIEDLNDNAPSLVLQNNPVIKENVEPGYKIVTIFAKDPDSPANGPPFKFAEPPNSSVRNLFRLSYNPALDNGNGGVEIFSNVRFDHESAKSYQVPILVSDSGSPPQSAVRYVTVQVLDEDDNPMSNTIKTIQVYKSYKGQMQRSPIGQIHIEDVDAVNATGRSYSFINENRPQAFDVDSRTGMLYVDGKVNPGQFSFQVKVEDQRTGEHAVSNISVNVDMLTEEALINSGSIRVQGVKPEEFLGRSERGSNGYERLRNKLKELLAKVTSASTDSSGANAIVSDSTASLFRRDSSSPEANLPFDGTRNPPSINVHIFSIVQTKTQPAMLEIRYYALVDSRYKPAIALNGLVQLRRREVSAAINAQIVEVGINPCFTEKCPGGCSHSLSPKPDPVLINTRMFSFVGIATQTEAKCACPRGVGLSSSCTKYTCLNGGLCHDTGTDYFCECRDPNLFGARCEGITRSFRGQGYAWLNPLPNCDHLQISFELLTRAPNAMLFYNGPTDIIDLTNYEKAQFISLSLVGGRPVLQIDIGFGVGRMEFADSKGPILNDGEWHRIDIRRDQQILDLTVDKCRSANQPNRDGILDINNCKMTAQIPGPVDILSFTAPLQLGGTANSSEAKYPSTLPSVPSLDGCIRDFRINGELFDLVNPAIEENTQEGCSHTSAFCSAYNNGTREPFCVHGDCRANMAGSTKQCVCQPGWHGERCSESFSWVRLTEKSQIVYQFINAKLRDPFNSDARIMILPAQSTPSGALFRSNSASNGQAVTALQLAQGRVSYRFDTGTRAAGKSLALPNVVLSSNQSYFLRAQRHNDYARLSLDDHLYPFEAELFGNDSIIPFFIENDKFLLGSDDRTTAKFEGCVSDIWWNDFFIPVDEVEATRTQYMKQIARSNVETGCPTFPTCANSPDLCSFPFVCVDFWKGAFCTCSSGSQPMLNDAGVLVSCNTESLVRKEAGLGITHGAIIAIVISALVLVCLLLFLIIWVSRHRRPAVYPSSESDTFDNIVNYLEEGGGEEDQQAYDISHLRRPVMNAKDDGAQDSISRKPVVPVTEFLPTGKPFSSDKYGGIKDFLTDRMADADVDPMAPPFDELRQYDYEGDGLSAASSLSSLASSGDDGVDWDEKLSTWGPRFQHLADLCGGEDDDE